MHSVLTKLLTQELFQKHLSQVRCRLEMFSNSVKQKSFTLISLITYLEESLSTQLYKMFEFRKPLFMDFNFTQLIQHPVFIW